MIDIDIHTIAKEDLKNYELIDIREAQEIDEWPPLVPCRHVPLSQFPLNKDAFDKNTSYLLYCAKGGRSHYLAEILISEGYKAQSVNNGIASLNSYLKKLDS
jgi:rhodanese-related sulfurtransferase